MRRRENFTKLPINEKQTGVNVELTEKKKAFETNQFKDGLGLDGVRTLIALHCGSDKSIMAVKAAEISRFWLNIP